MKAFLDLTVLNINPAERWKFWKRRKVVILKKSKKRRPKVEAKFATVSSNEVIVNVGVFQNSDEICTMEDMQDDDVKRLFDFTGKKEKTSIIINIKPALVQKKFGGYQLLRKGRIYFE